MSFMFDKPLIVRLLQIVFAVVGVLMIYVAVISTSDLLFSIITGAIGVVCIVSGTLIALRKWYAWHVTLAVLIFFAGYLVLSYAETMDTLWIMVAILDLMVVVSWSVGFTRKYFDAAAA